MRKSALWVIISLMTIAMVGLISFQIYWINSAILVHEQRFNQNIHEALNQVVNQLEKREVYYAATNSLNFNNIWSFRPNMDSMFFAQRSSTGRNPVSTNGIQMNNQGSWQSIVEFEDSFNIGNQHITVSYKINDRLVPDHNEIVEHNISAIHEADLNVQIDSFEWVNQEVRKNLEKVAEKSQMVTIVLDELMNPNKTIQRRVTKMELENLMDEALAGRGINLDYEYLVYGNRDRNVYYTNYSQNTQQNLAESNMTVNLYPNDIIGPQTLLSISFPDQFGFLLKQIWFTLSSSFFLVVLIIFSFTYAVLTIIRQKKLSEMKNDFINNMTHELKTPISTVSLACEALQDQEISRNESFFNKYVRVINDENNRLGRQVEKVLQMARLERKDFK
ncbi:histidine kinase dimerization/phospho-acceptor domain-containing protein, partial [Bacteroidota bacterium]